MACGSCESEKTPEEKKVFVQIAKKTGVPSSRSLKVEIKKNTPPSKRYVK